MVPPVSEHDKTWAQLRRYKWVFVVFWTGAVAVSLAWNIRHQNRATDDMARSTADIAFEKDDFYRRWAAGHGGVYAPATEKTPPNLFLAHVPERDITTPSGRKLTLVNPPSMTRQVHEVGGAQVGAKGHITSLKPMRPENAADAWETEALQAFEHGVTEVSSIEKLDGELHMRLMRPLYAERGCLKCHAQQGYELGDVRGGISVSVPMAPLQALARPRIAALCFGHGGLWILGLAGIAMGMRHVHRHVRQRDQAEEVLHKTESALRKHRDHLKELVGERTAELTKINDALLHEVEERREAEKAAAAASSAKGDFLATMSHELRTPLHGIIGMTELLLGAGLTREQKRQAGLVKTSGDVLLRLINDILDFSRIEAGKLELEITDFDLRDSVEYVATLLGPQAVQKGLELTVGVNPAIPTSLRGDPGRLQQILMNLVWNAIKFTEHGGIVIRAAVDSENESSVSLRISVTDTGIGILADKQEFLFQSFSQLDASHSRRFGGTGLGLAISKQLVEMMGGEIGAISETGRGSTFWFSVTLEKGRGAGTPLQIPTDLRRVRVLAVDDNATSRDILDEHLTGFGIAHAIAPDGESALTTLRDAAASKAPFGLVLVELEMAGMNGEQLAQAVKSDPDIGNPVLLLLTAAGTTADDERMKTLGFSALLPKPIGQTQLLDAITQALACARVDTGHKPEEKTDSNQPFAQQARTAGAKILAVEDNHVSQEVLRQILSQAGYAHEIVANGREAVGVWHDGDFDLILMDCEMPEMDGFEATREIRRIEKENANDASAPPRTPIVALTANAFKGDREKCLEAGMDDYVAKPFVPGQLIEAIESQLANGEKQEMTSLESGSSGRANDDPASGSPPGGCTNGTRPPYHLDIVLKRWGNDRTFVERLITKFRERAPYDLEKLRQAVMAEDAGETARLAHGLKGAAGYVAAEKVRKLASKLETMGRGGDLSQAEECLKQLKSEVARCVEGASGHSARSSQLTGEYANLERDTQ